MTSASEAIAKNIFIISFLFEWNKTPPQKMRRPDDELVRRVAGAPAVDRCAFARPNRKRPT
jgi:hypothetical protein